MGEVVSLLPTLVGGAALVVSALIMVSMWRSEPYRKWFYLYLTITPVWWSFILDKLFVLVGVPFAWQVGVDGVLMAVMVAALVLLYRHRHDPDPEEP